jgi:type IV pilus assembly protein PilV
VRIYARLNSLAGFTIVEFLVAIVILMFGLLALLQSVNIAIESNGSNKKRTGAAQLADQAMMRVRVMPFNSITTMGLKTTTEYATLTKKSYAGLGFVNYSVYDTVNKLAATTKNVQINVSWREKSVQKRHSLVSVVGTPP